MSDGRGAHRRRWRSPRTARPTSPPPSPFRPASRPRAASSTGAAACWPARPSRTPWPGRATAGSTGARRTGAPSRPGAVVGVLQGELARILRAERPMLNLLQRASRDRDRDPGLRGRGRRHRLPHPPHPEDRAGAPGARHRRGAGRRRRRAPGGPGPRGDGQGQPLAGGWRGAAARWRTRSSEARRRGVTALYVEVESLEQLEQACAAGATRLLVDNQTPETVPALGRAGAGAAARDRDRGDGRDHAGERAGVRGGGRGLRLDRRADAQRAGGGPGGGGAGGELVSGRVRWPSIGCSCSPRRHGGHGGNTEEQVPTHSSGVVAPCPPCPPCLRGERAARSQPPTEPSAPNSVHRRHAPRARPLHARQP